MKPIDYKPELPKKWESMLIDIKAKAAIDKNLEHALRGMLRHYEYAQGVLSVLGLNRLGADYVEAKRSERIAWSDLEKALDKHVPTGNFFVDAFPTSPEIEKLREEYEYKNKWLKEIESYVKMVAKCDPLSYALTEFED